MRVTTVVVKAEMGINIWVPSMGTRDIVLLALLSKEGENGCYVGCL